MLFEILLIRRVVPIYESTLVILDRFVTVGDLELSVTFLTGGTVHNRDLPIYSGQYSAQLVAEWLMNQRIRTGVELVLFVALCEIAGVVGAFFTTSSISTWYAGIRKPDLAPPNWVFAPVWTTLYGLMGVSLFLVWGKTLGKDLGRLAIAVFIIQLILNVLWSYLFFGLRSPFLGLVEITILWFAIAATLAFFIRISRTAGLMLLPYLGWVSLAGYLNYMIFILNT